MVCNLTVIADFEAPGALAFTQSTIAENAGVAHVDVLHKEPQGILEIAAGSDSLYALAALELLATRADDACLIVRSGAAFLNAPHRMLAHARARGVAAPRRTLQLGDDGFEPSFRALAADGLAIPEVVAATDRGSDVLREVALRAREDLNELRFDAPYQRLANLAAYDANYIICEPTVVDAAWLREDHDVSSDTEIVVLPHWRSDRPWVPDGRQFFPRVTALGRPVLQEFLEARLDADGRYGAPPVGRDGLCELARTLLAERIDVSSVASASPAEFEAWLAEPADVAWSQRKLPRGLHLVWSVRADLQRAFPDIPGDDEARLLEWGKHDTNWAGKANLRIIGEAASSPQRRQRVSVPQAFRRSTKRIHGADVATQEGVLVFGLLNAANGLGNVARDLVSTIASSLGADGVSQRTWDTTWRAKLGAAIHEGPPREAAIAVHGAQSDYVDVVDDDFFRADRRIGVVFWEIDCPIPGVEDFGRIYTELWAPSEFLAGVYRKQTDLPVHVMPQHVEFEGSDDLEASRALRAERDPYVLLTFDHYSVMARKNPTGAIDAFVAALGPDDGVRLIIKSINGNRYRRPHAELVRRASKHRHVEIRDGFLPRSEVLCLAAGASTYVSLHRGEGLGLTIAEAMAMGVPAVATAYGGNLDFMREGNCHLVGCTQIEVGDEGFPYPRDATWADPDPVQAAAAIRAALTAEDSSELGLRGREDVLANFDLGRQVDFLRAQGIV